MSITLVTIGTAVGVTIGGSMLQFAKQKTVWRLLQLLGAVCLGIMVLTHIAEEFRLFPEMGWGQPDSTGHYLDLMSAVLGFTLLPFGYASARRSERKNSK